MVIEAIVGEVCELSHKVTPQGPFIRAMIVQPGDDQRRLSVWLPLQDARGLALGTKVRVLVEVLQATIDRDAQAQAEFGLDERFRQQQARERLGREPWPGEERGE